MNEAPITYLLVDGENIDATLGNALLGRRPESEERPRWDRVYDFVERQWQAPVRALFFLNASSGSLPMTFVQALLAMRYRVIPLSGSEETKVVDVAIQSTLEAIRRRPSNVVLASHDGDFSAAMASLAASGRRVAVLGFEECMSQSYKTDDRIDFFDLELDVKAFTKPLPRVRIIPIEEFDPELFL